MMQTGEKLVTSRSGKAGNALESNLNYTGTVITGLKKDVALLEGNAESETLACSANPDDKTYFIPAF